MSLEFFERTHVIYGIIEQLQQIDLYAVTRIQM